MVLVTHLEDSAPEKSLNMSQLKNISLSAELKITEYQKKCFQCPMILSTLKVFYENKCII